MDFGYNYSYDYDYNVPVYSDSGSEVLSVLIGSYLIILGGALLIMLVGYVFHSIGMYTIGKRMGKAHPWMAFVPFARDYFQGELAGPIRLKNKEIRNPGIWNLVLPIIFSAVTGVLTTVMIVGTVMGLLAADTMWSAGALAGTVMSLIMFYVALIVFSVVYSAVYMVLKILINRQIFAAFTTDNMSVVHAVLSSVIPLYEVFCTFVFRNKEFNETAV